MSELIQRKGQLTVKKEIEWTVQRAPGIGTVYYTTGAKKYCGKEIELKLPLSEENSVGILNRAVNFCKESEHKFSEGEEIAGLLSIPVKVIEVMPSATKYPSDTVFRLLLADEKGKFPDDEDCNPVFKNQAFSNEPHN